MASTETENNAKNLFKQRLSVIIKTKREVIRNLKELLSLVYDIRTKHAAFLKLIAA